MPFIEPGGGSGKTEAFLCSRTCAKIRIFMNRIDEVVHFCYFTRVFAASSEREREREREVKEIDTFKMKDTGRESQQERESEREREREREREKSVWSKK